MHPELKKALEVAEKKGLNARTAPYIDGALAASVSGPVALDPLEMLILLVNEPVSNGLTEELSKQCAGFITDLIFYSANLEMAIESGELADHLADQCASQEDLKDWCRGFASAAHQLKREWQTGKHLTIWRRVQEISVFGGLGSLLGKLLKGANLNVRELEEAGIPKLAQMVFDIYEYWFDKRDIEDVGFEDEDLLEDAEYDELEPTDFDTPLVSGPKVGRNDPCPCGSGKKYKKCCGRQGAGAVLGSETDVADHEGKVLTFKGKGDKPETGKPRCGICGKTENLIKTPCCGNWICDDEDQYVMFSYARNSCLRNHRRFTLCGSHYANGHEGDWQTCEECKKHFSPEMEMYVHFGTNEYNFEKLKNPPAFMPTYCSKCHRRIVLSEEGFTMKGDKYVCADCEPMVAW